MKCLVIIVDYNGSTDTIECLESLARMHGDFDVVVVDNSPSNELAGILSSWASNQDPWTFPSNEIWNGLRKEPRHKAVTFRSIAKEEIRHVEDAQPPFITLIAAKENRGFAAGNNLGLLYGMGRDYEVFWLLNNDTVVLPNTLAEMLDVSTLVDKFGICGATVALYNPSNRVQCHSGAIFDKARARSMYVGYHAPLFPLPDRVSVENRVDMVVGASMLVSREFVETVGLMNEGYFLYFEEMDWIARNADRFKIIYSPKAIVHHKHGATTKKNVKTKVIGSIPMKYLYPNRLVFTDRYSPEKKFGVRFGILVEALKACVKRDFQGGISLASTALGPVPNRPSIIPSIAPNFAASFPDDGNALQTQDNAPDKRAL